MKNEYVLILIATITGLLITTTASAFAQEPPLTVPPPPAEEGADQPPTDDEVPTPQQTDKLILGTITIPITGDTNLSLESATSKITVSPK